MKRTNNDLEVMLLITDTCIDKTKNKNKNKMGEKKKDPCYATCILLKKMSKSRLNVGIFISLFYLIFVLFFELLRSHFFPDSESIHKLNKLQK